MSYIFLQEQGEVSSVDSYSDIPQSVLLKLKNTQDRFCSSDSETECCQSFPSGTMSAPLMESLGEEQLMLFAEDSPAKTSVQREREPALEESVRDYGKNILGLLERYGLSLSLRKTLRFCGVAGLTLSSETCPTWGMMQDGACWELGTSARPIEEIGCGSWATPNSRDYKGIPGWKNQKSLPKDVGGIPNPTWLEWLMGWPVGWTGLKPLETDRFQQWQQQHGTF